MAMRRFIDQTLATPGASTKPNHVGFGRCFVNKNEPSQLCLPPLSPPDLACRHDIGTILLGGVQRLFFNVRSSLSSVSQIRVVLASMPCVSNSQTFISASVRSGAEATCSLIAPYKAASFGGTWHRCGRAVVSPVPARRESALETYDILTNSISVISPTEVPMSAAAKTLSRRSCPYALPRCHNIAASRSDHSGT